ncbi:altronate oxidoreductase [Salegentibacter salinarum]|uniref:Altronate oxidoreductase n=1 Tax=Salegentibacter salinarum TaxID=447422 RepID=A0A2N0TNX6_9FLAO|nr:tagaturonate reductase [Salegentibacter salinarum]PKD16440.1 altronate oxidoreductase [Salegentibacter salinarum]SKB64311.1 tagaturonate reductase [Salegentibacter salinarum]
MKRLNRENTGINKELPIKVVQFGEGNFLRAFVDYVIDKLNEQANFNAGVAVVQPIASGMVSMLNEQDGLYNLFMRGIKNGKQIQEQRTISCIQKGINPYENYAQYMALAEEEQLQFVISNTTEAGISFDEKDTLEGVPHNSFPAKLTAILYKRFQHFNGDNQKGLNIIPCELINHNADTLKEIILKYAELWNLEKEFKDWLDQANSFHNTLVDRIVPGYPKDDIENYQKELEFEDKLVVTAEVFLLWVIEGGKELKQKIPFDKIDENILVVEDMQPYRTRKVRILNGAHTTMVPFSLLYGNETVKETIDNSFTGEFIKEAVFEEINSTLSLRKEELETFASEVFDRFRNPFIKHQLTSIALNSISKFKVRVLPSLLAYQRKNNELPLRLTYAMACLIIFYRGQWEGKLLPVKDDAQITDFFQRVWEQNSYKDIARDVLQKKEYWGEDLTEIPGFKKNIAYALELIENKGIEEGFLIFSEELRVQ